MRWWRGAASPPDERVVQRREREEPERQRRIGVEPTRSKTTSGRPQIGARYSAPAPVKTSIRPAVTEFVRRRDTAVDGNWAQNSFLTAGSSGDDATAA